MEIVLFIWLIALFGKIFNNDGDLLTWDTVWKAVRWAAAIYVVVWAIFFFAFLR